MVMMKVWESHSKKIVEQEHVRGLQNGGNAEGCGAIVESLRVYEDE